MAKKRAPTTTGILIDRSARIERGRQVLELIEGRVSESGRTRKESFLGYSPRDVAPATRKKYRQEAIWQVAHETSLPAEVVEVDCQLAELLDRICPSPKLANGTQRDLLDAVTTGRLPLTHESLNRFLKSPKDELLDALKEWLGEQI